MILDAIRFKPQPCAVQNILPQIHYYARTVAGNTKIEIVDRLGNSNGTYILFKGPNSPVVFVRGTVTIELERMSRKELSELFLRNSDATTIISGTNRREPLETQRDNTKSAVEAVGNPQTGKSIKETRFVLNQYLLVCEIRNRPSAETSEKIQAQFDLELDGYKIILDFTKNMVRFIFPYKCTKTLDVIAQESEASRIYIGENVLKIMEKEIEKWRNECANYKPPTRISEEPLSIDPETPDKRWLTELVNNQYSEAADLVNAFTLTPQDKPVPTKAKLLNAVLRDLGPKEVAMLKTLEEPTLLLEPIMSLPRLTKGLNNPDYKKIPHQRDVFFSDSPYYNAVNIMTKNAEKDGCTDEKIIGYRFVITEGAEKQKSNGTYNSATQKRVDKRIEEFDTAFAGTKVRGLTYKGYAMLLLKWQKRGIKGDNYAEKSGTYSILNGEASKKNRVAAGFWDTGFSLKFNTLDSTNDDARLRPSVIGNI